MNQEKLEESYIEFSNNLTKWAPDGIIPVSLSLLHEIGVLTFEGMASICSEEIATNFEVIETEEKVTLLNDIFVIWIVPTQFGLTPATLIYIALQEESSLHLELVFSTSGVYNTPRYILKVLEYFLHEVHDNESIISALKKKT